MLQSIAEKEDLTSEKRLIEQVARLEAELLKHQREAGASRRVLDSSRSISGRPSKRKLETVPERRATRESLSTELLLRREEPDRAEKRRLAFDEAYLSGSKDVLFDLFISEIHQVKTSLQLNIEELARNFEQELTQLESQLAAADALQDQAEEHAQSLAASNKQLKAEIGTLNRQIAALLRGSEEAAMARHELEEKLRDQAELGEKMKRDLVEKLRADLREQEARVADGDRLIEKLTSERNEQSMRLRQLENVNNRAEKLTVQSEGQVEELQKRLNVLSEEHERLKLRYNSVLRDKEALTKDLTANFDQLETIRRDHLDTIDALTVKFNAKIKQLEEDKERKVPPMNSLRGLNASGFLSSDFNGNLNGFDDPFDQGLTSDLPLPKTIEANELDRDHDIQILGELEEKNTQLNALREQVIELKTKLAGGSSRDAGKKDLEINRLALEIAHLKESFDAAKEGWAKEKAVYEKNHEDLYTDYVEYKIGSVARLMERDKREEAFRRNQKMLKMRVEIYEKQIMEFNGKIA